MITLNITSSRTCYRLNLLFWMCDFFLSFGCIISLAVVPNIAHAFTCTLVPGVYLTLVIVNVWSLSILLLQICYHYCSPYRSLFLLISLFWVRNLSCRCECVVVLALANVCLLSLLLSLVLSISITPVITIPLTLMDVWLVRVQLSKTIMEEGLEHAQLMLPLLFDNYLPALARCLR